MSRAQLGATALYRNANVLINRLKSTQKLTETHKKSQFKHRFETLFKHL